MKIQLKKIDIAYYNYNSFDFIIINLPATHLSDEQTVHITINRAIIISSSDGFVFHLNGTKLFRIINYLTDYLDNDYKVNDLILFPELFNTLKRNTW